MSKNIQNTSDPVQHGAEAATGTDGYRDDERVARTGASRASRSQTPEEDDRRGREILDMTDEERAQFLRDEFTTQTLPTVPPIKGYHVCWLSTTNQYDTIMRRMRLGYQPVRPDDLPQGFASLSLKTGEYSGCVGVNEMVLFKIPENVYQALMKTFHHDLPNEEADKLRRSWEAINNKGLAGDKGPHIPEIGDGTEELLRRDRRKPLFA